MNSDYSLDSDLFNNKYMVWFFAGGEATDNRFNMFTGSYISLMKEILGDDFELIKGIYFKSSMMNVIWALNNAQRPIPNPERERITGSAIKQIISHNLTPSDQLIITSSSSGSIVAAQVACYLAENNITNKYFNKPFHLVLGSSMIYTGSELFRQLEKYQDEGIIGSIIHNEIQDEGDTSAGIGGLSRFEAYSNAFGLMFPWFSKKFKAPSFLNAHPEKGHLHRKRSKTIQKALDYIEVILIRNKLAGDHYMEKAKAVIEKGKIIST